MIYSGYDTVCGPCKDALRIAKPATAGALLVAMEGRIMSHAISRIEIDPLLGQARRMADDSVL